MPAMRALSIALPPPPTSGRGGAVAAPAFQQPELVTIDGIVDSIEVMSSLQKPKKVRPRCTARCARHAARAAAALWEGQGRPASQGASGPGAGHR